MLNIKNINRLINYSNIYLDYKIENINREFIIDLDNKIRDLIIFEFNKKYSININNIDKYYEVPLINNNYHDISVSNNQISMSNQISISSNQMSNQISMSSLSLGISGEKYVEQVFKMNKIKYKYTGNINHKGDYYIYKEDELPILVEVKNYKNSVDFKEVNKFVNDINSNEVLGGVFISLRSKINKLDNNKYSYFNKYNNLNDKIKLKKNIPILFIQCIDDKILNSMDILSGIKCMMDINLSSEILLNPEDILLNLRDIDIGSKVLNDHLNDLVNTIYKFVRESKVEIKKISSNNYKISKKIYSIDKCDRFIKSLPYVINDKTDMNLLSDILLYLNPYDDLKK